MPAITDITPSMYGLEHPCCHISAPLYSLVKICIFVYFPVYPITRWAIRCCCFKLWLLLWLLSCLYVMIGAAIVFQDKFINFCKNFHHFFCENYFAGFLVMCVKFLWIREDVGENLKLIELVILFIGLFKIFQRLISFCGIKKYN